MDYKYFLVSLVLVFNSLPSVVYCKHGKQRPSQHESSSSNGDSFAYSNHNEIYEDQIATETNLWRPITTKNVPAVSNEEAEVPLRQVQKYAIRHSEGPDNKGERKFLEYSDLNSLSSSGSAQDYVKKALEMRLKQLNEETSEANYPQPEQDSAHSFSDYSIRHEVPKKNIDIEKQKEKIVRVIRPNKPPQIKVMMEDTDTSASNYVREETQYSTLPTPETSTSSMGGNRPRKRLRVRRPNSTDLNEPSDSTIVSSYVTPKENIDQINRPYVSKSPTYRHSEYSTSSHYYYDPIVTDSGISIQTVKDPKNHRPYKKQFNQTNFDNSFGYGMKMGNRPQNDVDAYYYTHPTPNPSTTTTTTTTEAPTSSRRPYRRNPEQRSRTRAPVQTVAQSTFLPHVTPYEKKYRTTSSPNINANVITHSNIGSTEEFDVTTPIVKPKPMYTIRHKGSQKMRIVIKTTARPLMQQIQDMEEIANAAESQIVTSVKLPPNTKLSQSDDKFKHHTPNFEFNEYEKTRVPVYYNVDLNDYNGTVSPAFNNGDPTTKASVVRPGIEQALNEPDRRNLMTYNPDDSDTDTTPKSLPRKALSSNDSLVEGDLDTEASDKKAYLILYDYDDHEKPKHKPRPRMPHKPAQVTQQIHYHHHGGDHQTQEKTYNTAGYKGSYAGNKGNSYVEEEDDDDGPDVTHTHHEYVHFDNEPAVTHHYQNGPMTDHYDMTRPALNAIYDVKTAKDYDLRHQASHDLDTRHVPVGDYSTIKSSHMYNSGKVDDTYMRNNYNERPYYYYQSERQIDQYDNQAFGSSPQKTVVRPDSMRKHTLKVVDPRDPKQTVEITKDDYVRHVKLAVEKYLKSTDAPNSFQHSKETPYFKPSKPFNFDDTYQTAENEEATNIHPKKRLPPARDMHPPRGVMKAIERPPDFSEGYPMSLEAFNSLKDNLEAAYGPAIKPVTLPPRKHMQQQHQHQHQQKRVIPSTPSPFMVHHHHHQQQQQQQRPGSLPPFGAGKYPPNFKIMNHMKIPKQTFGAGRPLQDQIYNLQENLAHDVDLTVKNLKSTPRPLDMSTIEVGQLYHHGNPFDPTKHPVSQNFDPKPKLQFNNQVYHDINALMNKNVKNFQDSDAAQTFGFAQTDKRRRRPTKHVQDSTGQQGMHSIAQNSAALNNELENSPIHIINGIPVANPYNIDMDTLKYMLGGMHDGLAGAASNNPADPFNMKVLKSLPNVATVPTAASSFSNQNLAFQHPPKNHQNHARGKPRTSGFVPSPSFNGNSNNALANNPFQASQQWESSFNQPFTVENGYTMTTQEPQLYLKAFRRVPNKKISSKAGPHDLETGLKPPPNVLNHLIAMQKKKKMRG